MDESDEVDKSLKEFKKYIYINSFLGIVSLMAVSLWIINNQGIIDYAGEIPFLKVFIKKLNLITAIGIFLSGLSSTVLTLKLFRRLLQVVHLLNEKVKNNKIDF